MMQSMQFDSKTKDKWHLVSCGYLRKYFSSKNINPSNIGQIIATFLRMEWKFDHFYEYNKQGLKIHGIEDNGKTLYCNLSRNWCHCCFISYSFGMKPNTGEYNIKFKINQIGNQSYGNVLGMLSEDSN